MARVEEHVERAHRLAGELQVVLEDLHEARESNGGKVPQGLRRLEHQIEDIATHPALAGL
jgi:hypothetical protein